MTKPLPDRTVPISGERLARAIELRQCSIYSLAQAIAAPAEFAAMKEAIRVIVSGRVTRTGEWRLKLLAKELRVPAKWLRGEGPLVPTVPLTSTEADGVTARDLASWDLFRSWFEGFTRLKISELPDEGDESSLLAGLNEWWFLPSHLAPLLDAGVWRKRLIHQSTDRPTGREAREIEEASRHLIEAFRLILLPWTRDPSSKVDLGELRRLLPNSDPGRSRPPRKRRSASK